MNNLLKILILIIGFNTFSVARAARPMMTDDARIVDPKSCQLESWVRDSKHMTEYWAQPGCNVGENAEITIGGSLEGENSHSSFAILLFINSISSLYSNEEEVGGGGIVLSRLKIPTSIYRMSSCSSLEKDDELQKIIERHKASQIFLYKFNFYTPKK